MVWIAAIVALGIGNYACFVILFTINLLSTFLSLYQEMEAENAVAQHEQSLRPVASCMRDGVWDHTFDAALLVPGDLVLISMGALVPADVMVSDGEVMIDESALSGEVTPVSVGIGGLAMMGTSVTRGEAEGTVVATGTNTMFGKTVAMLRVSDDDRASKEPRFTLAKFALVCTSMPLCLISLIYLLAIGESVEKSFSFVLLLLVASFPFALDAVPLLTLVLGSRQLCALGVSIQRLLAIEKLAEMNVLCVEMADILTKSKKEIQPQAALLSPGVTQRDLLRWAAMASRWEVPPENAMDAMVLRCPLWGENIDRSMNPGSTIEAREACEDHCYEQGLTEAMQDYERLEFRPFEPRTKCTESTVRQKSTGLIFKVSRGAPHIVAELEENDEEMARSVQEIVRKYEEDGLRCMAIAISDPIPSAHGVEEIVVTWHLQGLLTYLAPPRDDARSAIARSERLGVSVRMLSRDRSAIARQTCIAVALGNRADSDWPVLLGPSDLPCRTPNGLPPDDLAARDGGRIERADCFVEAHSEHRHMIVQCLKMLGYTPGLTGDGCGDAPALKAADVGIAAVGATDSARAAADVVIGREGLGAIVDGVEISREIIKRMKVFLTYFIASSLQLAIFFFLALYAFVPAHYFPTAPGQPAPQDAEWPAFFSLPVLMVLAVIVLNNGVALCAIGYDTAPAASRAPERWSMPAIFVVATTLCSVACISSLILLHLCLDSWSADGFFQEVFIGGLQYGQIVNVMFLKLSLSQLMTLVTARTQEDFFWASSPSLVMWIGATFALTVSTLLALFWPIGLLEHLPVYGLAWEEGNIIALWVWLYCLFFFFLQDLVKVGCFWVMKRFNIFM